MIFTAMLALLPTAFAIAAGAPGRLGRVSSNAGPAICPTLKTAPVYSITDCAKGDLKAVYSEKAEVSLTCFVTGEAVGENVYWDKTSDGHFVPEVYVDTECAYGLPPCPGFKMPAPAR